MPVWCRPASCVERLLPGGTNVGSGSSPDISIPEMDYDAAPRSNENTNGLLRQYFPKGTDLSGYSQSYLNKIALRLNQRPRKTLGFETPADRLRAVLQ